MQVWAILTDFSSYPDWNPFIKHLEGDISVGGRFTVKIHPPGGKAMTFKPVCLNFEPGKLFSWKGRLFVPGLFDGEHIFELQELENGKTRLLHSENFKGILVGMLWKQQIRVLAKDLSK